MQVVLPTVEKFLMLYSLRAGSLTVLLWTLLRSFLSLTFFVIATLKIFAFRHFPFGGLLVDASFKDYDPINVDNVYTVYGCYICLIVSEAFLFFHMTYLVVGLYTEKSRMFVPYLICRFITWLLETSCLFALCLIHRLLIGWYLLMLFFIILEFYSFIVVYSYYAFLLDCEAFLCSKSQMSIKYSED